MAVGYVREGPRGHLSAVLCPEEGRRTALQSLSGLASKRGPRRRGCQHRRPWERKSVAGNRPDWR